MTQCAVTFFLPFPYWSRIDECLYILTQAAWPSRTFEVKIGLDTAVGPVSTCCATCDSSIDHYIIQDANSQTLLFELSYFYHAYCKFKLFSSVLGLVQAIFVNFRISPKLDQLFWSSSSEILFFEFKCEFGKKKKNEFEFVALIPAVFKA